MWPVGKCPIYSPNGSFRYANQAPETWQLGRRLIEPRQGVV